MPLAVQEPIDVVKMCLDENVKVKMKGDKTLLGKLHAFDQHLNLVLGDVTEVKEIYDAASETPGIPFSKAIGLNRTERTFELIFVRGDSLIMLSPVAIK